MSSTLIKLGLQSLAPNLAKIAGVTIAASGAYTVFQGFTNGQKVGGTLDLLKGLVNLDQAKFDSDGGTEPGTVLSGVGNLINGAASNVFLFASRQPYGAGLKKYMPVFLAYQVAMLGSEILFPDGDGKDSSDKAALALKIAMGTNALGAGSLISSIGHSATLLQKRSGLIKQLAEKGLTPNKIAKLSRKLQGTERALDGLSSPVVSYIKPVVDSVKRTWSMAA